MSPRGQITNFPYSANFDSVASAILSPVYLTVPKPLPTKDAMNLAFKMEEGALSSLQKPEEARDGLPPEPRKEPASPTLEFQPCKTQFWISASKAVREYI